MADGRVNDFKLQIIALWPGHLPEGRWQTIKDHFSLGVCDAALVGGSARWEGLFSVFFKRIFCFAFRTLGPRYNSWYVCFSLSFFLLLLPSAWPCNEWGWARGQNFYRPHPGLQTCASCGIVG